MNSELREIINIIKTFTFEEYQEYQEKTNKIIGRINKQLSKQNEKTLKIAEKLAA